MRYQYQGPNQAHVQTPSQQSRHWAGIRRLQIGRAKMSFPHLSITYKESVKGRFAFQKQAEPKFDDWSQGQSDFTNEGDQQLGTLTDTLNMESRFVQQHKITDFFGFFFQN
jgi:hypothetical protein